MVAARLSGMIGSETGATSGTGGGISDLGDTGSEGGSRLSILLDGSSSLNGGIWIPSGLGGSLLLSISTS